MKPYSLAALSLVFILGSTSAQEVDTRSPQDRYRGDTQAALLLCRLSWQLFQTIPRGDDTDDKTRASADYAKCISEHRRIGVASYAAYAKHVRKPAAREALKTYHAIWMTTLQGIHSSGDELLIDYRRRHLAADTRLEEAWARFEIEIPL